jgi:hypothetical protein
LIIVSMQGTMELTDKDQEVRLESLNALFKTLYDQQEIVQEVSIDGVDYREGYNNYLLENMMDIKSVEIKTVHESILIKEIVVDLKDYLPKLIRACDSIAELLYGEMQQEEWSHFGQLMEGIQWVSQSVLAIRSHGERYDGLVPIQPAVVSFVAVIEKQIQELEAAMQHNDYTAVGDLIKYEMSESFKLLLTQMEADVIS